MVKLRWHMLPRKDDEAILRMLQLRDDGMSLTQIARAMKTTKGRVSGAVFRVDVEYALSENSPAQGVCDPAQPGNPTGRSFDVETNAVVAVPLSGPGALNPLPANGGM